ncbi:FAD-dependent monooxygenase [Ramlibacter albus]|uniref:FAD-dependent monooxygenase n=1 Tax=Ramlibacter albus TaxID=2079448 RepID=A0A923M446_9BURK|nr:FAD-dependent monooxygenase [Ramlibacter albus]MBC5763030.1 FAD-dependent monooxygenase [Ramlibacter albus]
MEPKAQRASERGRRLTPKPFDTDVVLVGGGPVGTGLAIELAQRGVRCILVERYEMPQPIPKGQNLTQRTMEHFHFWGVEEQVRQARTIPPEYGIGGLTAYGTLLGEYSYDWLQRERVQQYYFCRNERLPQYATEAALRKRLAQLESAKTMYGWSADAVRQGNDGVEVDVVARGDGERRTLRAKYVVGCDGSRSVIRQLGGISQTLSDHDRTMVLLVFRSTGLHDLLARYPGKSYYNVLQPELEGYWKFFGRVDLGSTWFFHAPVPAGTTSDNFDFRQYLIDAVGAPFDVEFRHIGFWDLRFALADRYRNGRVFIAGDAAHSHPPYGGYGVNTGLEDARNLGWKIAADLQGWAGPHLLDSYEQERRAVFESTARDFIAKSIEEDRKFLRRFDPKKDRDAFERAWSDRASGASDEVNAFEPNYEGSMIVCGAERNAGGSAVGSHAFKARPGHHMAPAALSSGKNAFESLGEAFTLFGFGAENEELDAFGIQAQAMRVPLRVVPVSAEGEASRFESRLMLVRPDHFVAWSGNCAGADAARRILEQSVGMIMR